MNQDIKSECCEAEILSAPVSKHSYWPTWTGQHDYQRVCSKCRKPCNARPADTFAEKEEHWAFGAGVPGVTSANVPNKTDTPAVQEWDWAKALDFLLNGYCEFKGKLKDTPIATELYNLIRKVETEAEERGKRDIIEHGAMLELKEKTAIIPVRVIEERINHARHELIEEAEREIKKLSNIEVKSIQGNREVKIEINAKSTKDILSLLAKLKQK